MFNHGHPVIGHTKVLEVRAAVSERGREGGEVVAGQREVSEAGIGSKHFGGNFRDVIETQVDFLHNKRGILMVT